MYTRIGDTPIVRDRRNEPTPAAAPTSSHGGGVPLILIGGVALVGVLWFIKRKTR